MVVKEKYHPEWNYKLPGGGIHDYETLAQGAIREVKEETGIDATFQGIIAWRHGHGLKIFKSDLYFCCVMRATSKEITIQPAEISEARWIPYDDFKVIARNSCAQFLQAYENTQITIQPEQTSPKCVLYTMRK